jgi:phosphate-selective porin
MRFLKPALLSALAMGIVTGVTPAQVRRRAAADTAVVSLRAQMEALTSQVTALKTELASAKAAMAEAAGKPADPAALEKVSEVSDRVSGMDERLLTAESDVAGLKKLKVSGYIQARFEHLDYENLADNATTTTNNTIKSSSTSINGSQGQSVFYIRRGRIKFTYTPGPLSEYVLYFDGSKNSVSLKEAYVKLTEPWSGFGANLTVGQMNWPFGIEIERSSSTREVPERSTVVRTLFPGERDRGAKLSVGNIKAGPATLGLDLGVYNGWGLDNSTFSWQDPTKQKDVIARGTIDLGWLGLCASYYDGQYYEPIKITKTYQANTSTGAITEVTSSTIVGEKRYYKGRIGGGLQAYRQLLPFGGTALISEYIMGREKGKPVAGWYAMLTQNIGTKLNLAFRGDAYDPFASNDTTEYVEFGGTKESREYDQTWTASGAVNYWWDGAVRLTLAYDYVVKDRNATMSIRPKYEDVRDNKLTAQVQIKF